MSEGGQHQRKGEFLLARLEKRALQRIAAALPHAVMPDHLTIIGIIGSALVFSGYLLANGAAGWLWLSSFGLAVNWFGDSLDGTIARYRKTERPRYGFYLDHLTDAYSTIAIGAGLGVSPYMTMWVGMTVVVAYLVMSINVYLETHAFGEFTFSYGALGPTEVRIFLIGLNAAAFFVGPRAFPALGPYATVFDAGALAAVLVMIVLLSVRVSGNLRRLARLEPARRIR